MGIAHPSSTLHILHYINEVSSLFCHYGNVSLLHGFIAIHIYFTSVIRITADFINSPSLVLIRFNSRVVHYIERRKKNSANLGNGTASNTDIDDGCDATVVLLKKGNASSPLLDKCVQVWSLSKFLHCFAATLSKFPQKAISADGGRTLVCIPSSAVLLWGRNENHDHQPLLSSHTPHDGLQNAYYRGQSHAHFHKHSYVKHCQN